MDNLDAPKTKAYFLKRLKELEKSINKHRYHEERLAKEIQELENQRKSYCIPLSQELEEKNHLMSLYKELGGNEWDI